MSTLLAKAIMVLAMFVMFLILLWVQRADAHDVYSEMKNKRGQTCCGGQDCRPYPASKVFVIQGGYLLGDGTFVPFTDAIPSPTEDYIRCDLGGQPARCFAVPGAS